MDVPNPYLPPESLLSARPSLSQAGFVIGLVFGLPFLATAGLAPLRLAEISRQDLVIEAALVMGGLAMGVFGVCWATRRPSGLGRFLVLGVAMGVALTTALYVLLMAGLGTWRSDELLVDTIQYFIWVTPIMSFWLVLLGTVVRWRVRVLVRRSAGAVSDRGANGEAA